ncbi:bacteriochlorophyll/chlorophyll synthetase [Chlorobaculum parvum NCIB 8327]|uniref:Bacteriochlorophyll/chlorophyll synthetase n=1 Tax=Chlorobaculum parvum (strain DSM 263 / NCIMB 8327) TaxID=517417 RepID=B3QP21_CHLP8|nr:bacteriochlorophyll/chlorophyll synthetase [Chlorobaculum parvum NCIB 8327]
MKFYSLVLHVIFEALSFDQPNAYRVSNNSPDNIPFDKTQERASSEVSRRKPFVQGRRSFEPVSSLSLFVRFLKPVTWIPVVWSFICGAVASGAFGWQQLGETKFWLAVLLTGPLATGTCQMLNDYFDRDLDEINEPNRPIPGGAISLKSATMLIALWSVLSVVVGWLVHPLIALYVVVGIINAHLYSANPIKLKKRLWAGNIIVAVSYLIIPWVAGEIAYRPDFSLHAITPSLIVATLYTIASTGTMTINDFKSIEGDRQVGIHTLPAVFGERKAALIAAIMIDLGQLMAAGYMFLIGEPVYGWVTAALVVPQFFLQFSLVRSPRTMDVRYNAIAQNFLVAGMMVCAFAIKAINP